MRAEGAGGAGGGGGGEQEEKNAWRLWKKRRSQTLVETLVGRGGGTGGRRNDGVVHTVGGKPVRAHAVRDRVMEQLNAVASPHDDPPGQPALLVFQTQNKRGLYSPRNPGE